MDKDAQIRQGCDVPELWEEHKNALRNFIFKRVKNREYTDDILQEIFLKVYNFCLYKSGVRNVKGWLFQIARNTIVDHFRQNLKHSGEDNGRIIEEVIEEDENLAFKDALDYIQPLIDFLPSKYAIPLKLSDLDGLNQKEVARQLNLSLPATKSRIQRARNLLKAEFITCCDFEASASGDLLSFQIKSSCTPLLEHRKNIRP